MTEIDKVKDGVQKVRTHVATGIAELPKAQEELGKADAAMRRFMQHLGALMQARDDFLGATGAVWDVLSKAAENLNEATSATEESGLANATIDNEVAQDIIGCVAKTKSNIDNVRALTAAATNDFRDQTAPLAGLQELAMETSDHIHFVAGPHGDRGFSLPVAFLMGQTTMSVTENYLKQF